MLNWSEYPSKVPPDFKRRVLAKLLPSAEVIKRASSDQLRLLHQKRLDLEKAIEAEPVRFFTPNVGAQYDFMTEMCDGLRNKFFLAGNKAGKSTGAAIIASEYATGEILWGRDHRTSLDLPFPIPNRGVYYADDFDSHKQTTLPTLLSWLPRRFIKDADRNSAGHVSDIFLINGSVINFRTYEQGYEKSEGKDWAWGICDEPPPRDIYTGIRRGLVVYDGVLVIAATLLREPWIWDEVEQQSVRVYSSTIYDNQWIPASSRDSFISTLTHEEREVRVYGRPVTISGVVYKDFRDDQPWVVPCETRYHDPIRETAWPIIMGVDPHERKPIHIIWFWLTPSNGLIAFDWAQVPSLGLDAIFDQINEREERHDQRTSICIIDPNRGSARQMGGRTWADEFAERGFGVQFGDDKMEMGHGDVRDFLWVPEGGQPRLVFQENLRGKGGPIHAMTRYAWDDWTRANRMNRDPKEKVREQYKDFPDIVRYVVRAVVSGQIDFEILTGFDSSEPLRIMERAPVGRSMY